MKKITIILIFFASVVYSQTNPTIIPRQKPIIGITSEIKMLMDIYDLYEKECFNDSVMFYNWIYYIANYNLDGHIEWVDTVYSEFPVNFHNIIMKHKTEKYKHKQPTFEGFMKYLKQQ